MDATLRGLWSSAVILCAAVAIGQPRATEPVRTSRVADRVYEVLGGSGARGGAYLGDNGVLLIDAKMDKPSVEQALAEVRKLSDQPVRYVVSTHSDGDHVEGNTFMPATALFVAQENCRRELFLPGRDGKPSAWLAAERQPFVPSVTFRDKLDIYLGTRHVELWHFGVGHTSGDTVVYLPEEKVAFLGDQLFTSRPQLIHTNKGGNSFAHVETLTKMLAQLDATVFLSGHSEPVNRAGVERHIAEIKAMQEKIRQLSAGGKGLDEIKKSFAENEAALVAVIYAEIRK